MKKVLLTSVLLTSILTASGTIDTPVAQAEESKSSFLDRFHSKNDMRLRYESIERDDKDDKYRTRYRLRLGVKVDLLDDLQLETGMRSGFANPTSGNQTFEEEPWSDYFFQSLRFNILGLKYTSDNATYKIGRQPYMMYRPIKSQLVWDNDVSMNGVNYQYKDSAQTITLGLNRPTLEEKAEAKETVNLLIAQYVHTSKLDNAKLNLGAGAYIYDGLKGNTMLFGSSKGNTKVDGLYTNDYHLVEAFGELQFKDVLGKPLKAAAGVVYNFGADDENFGYDLGLQLGKAKNVGDWQLKYSYTMLEADASFGAYSDSDNFGGGTAAKGHAIRTKYKMYDKVYLAGSFFFNTIDASKSSTDTEADYERVQLDAIIKF
ncbi:MAG: putative porin [Epsilonproteobacteria bacterium]|nr:putative porin [Campylobacterota bacterium]